MLASSCLTPQPAGASRQPIQSRRFTAVTDYSEAFKTARRHYAEDFHWQLEKKAGGPDALLALTKGKPRGEVEHFIGTFISELAEEGTPAASLLCTAHRFLFCKEEMLDALEAAPWGDDA